MPYEKIVISGKGYASTEAISVLSQHNGHVILVDTYDNQVTCVEPNRTVCCMKCRGMFGLYFLNYAFKRILS